MEKKEKNEVCLNPDFYLMRSQMLIISVCYHGNGSGNTKA